MSLEERMIKIIEVRSAPPVKYSSLGKKQK